ncbi:MAG: hypothetical protein J5I94_28040 [Phaeodactylibacter sp.]|nr:hypothetical protein [Phaeodactylibacter sp.]
MQLYRRQDSARDSKYKGPGIVFLHSYNGREERGCVIWPEGRRAACRAGQAELTGDMLLNISLAFLMLHGTILYVNHKKFSHEKALSENGDVLIVGGVYNLHMGMVEFIEETISSLPKFADK